MYCNVFLRHILERVILGTVFLVANQGNLISLHNLAPEKKSKINVIMQDPCLCGPCLRTRRSWRWASALFSMSQQWSSLRDGYWNGHPMHRTHSNTNAASASLPSESRSQWLGTDDLSTTKKLDVDIEATHKLHSHVQSIWKRPEANFPLLIQRGGGCCTVTPESI